MPGVLAGDPGLTIGDGLVAGGVHGLQVGHRAVIFQALDPFQTFLQLLNGGKGGYRDMAYPVTKEFREQLNTAVLQAYEAKLEQMAERGSVGRASISDQLKAGKAAAEQAKAERPPKEKPSRSAER